MYKVNFEKTLYRNFAPLYVLFFATQQDLRFSLYLKFNYANSF